MIYHTDPKMMNEWEKQTYDANRNWMAVKVEGEIYPRLQLRVVPVAKGKLFQMIDETGWDGFKEIPPFVTEIFTDARDAILNMKGLIEEEERTVQSRWSKLVEIADR